ncbi:MFS general substrate transporter [Aspergillus ellipticus CBS 707.79]|uniref:MFS general substrate transporter n=1 Tax=Aspergillus ellipticus CBS 707.79 TaxID=1448320 RepID=A0A319CTF3_9EURO|nr:MFS general substrate transporter [Aspergillus ellipticus CBS 707.79]
MESPIPPPLAPKPTTTTTTTTTSADPDQIPPPPPPTTPSLFKLLQSKLLKSDPVTDGYLLPKWQKSLILFTVSWMTLAITFSSTSLLPATPEIAAEFNTTTETLDVTNAGVLLAMGFSSLIWGPLNRLLGRRIAYNIAILVLCLASVGTAVAENMATFTALRVLGGLTGTGFMVTGQTVLADVFEPVVRGTAVGLFMMGTVSGPAIGPCIGGIIVTFASWRNIYWVQVAMTGFGLIMSLLFVPEIPSADAKTTTTTTDPASEKPTHPRITLHDILSAFNPVRVFRLWVYPNIFLAVRPFLPLIQ